MTDAPLLLPYQQRWIGDRSKIRVWEKSRRIGASWAAACESVLEAADADGMDTWYIAYSKEATQEFIIDCAAWAKSFGIAASSVEEHILDEAGDILTYRIRFASGKRISALSSRPTGLRNKKDRIIIDEAAHHEDLDGLIKAAIPVIMWGGRVDILSSHNGADSYFSGIVGNVRAGRLGYSLHRTTIDDAIGEGLVERICLVTGQDWSLLFQGRWRTDLFNLYGEHAREELLCIPSQSGATYMPRPLIERCMYRAPVFRHEAEDGFAQLPDAQRTRVIGDWITATLAGPLARLPQGQMHAFGEDFGRTADLTVIAPVTINQNLSRTIPFLIELRNVPFREQEQVLIHVVDRLPRFHYGALDEGGNGQYLAERAWQRYGESQIEQVRLSEKWYGENLPKTKAAFEDQMIAVPRDADVLSDLQAIQVIDGIPKLPKARKTQKAAAKKKGATRHGDAAIAIALADYASRIDLRQYRYESVPGRNARKGLD